MLQPRPRPATLLLNRATPVHRDGTEPFTAFGRVAELEPVRPRLATAGVPRRRSVGTRLGGAERERPPAGLARRLRALATGIRARADRAEDRAASSRRPERGAPVG